MAKRTIYAVGLDLPSVDGFETLEMVSDASLLDADIILFSPTLDDFNGYTYEGFQGKPLFDHAASHKVSEQRAHWRRQISAAYESGKLIVVFLPERQDRYRYTGEVQLSGTGRNRQRTNMVDATSNYDFLPMTLTNITVGRGTGMRLTQKGSVIAPYWAEFGSLSTYNAHFESNGTPLVETKTGGKTVAVHLQKGGGHCVVLPNVEWDSSEFVTTQDTWSEKAKQFSIRFRNAIFGLDKGLRGDSDLTPEPDWAKVDQYRLQAESIVENQIDALNTRIQQLENERALHRLALQETASLRGLLFEKGKPLEMAVRKALKILGFKAEGFKDGQSEFDAIFEAEEGRFLGETEGKDNAAVSVDKYSQLERNLNEDLQRDEVSERAVGVLFGNAFRLQPPADRADVFTAKVVSAAASTAVCLVRTPDLFVVAKYLADSPDEEFAKKCRAAFLEGRGRLVEFPAVPSGMVETVAEADD
jgi:hypothetical protein